MGLYIGLTGCRLGAKDLMQTGLATHFISSDRILHLEAEIIRNCPSANQDDEGRTKSIKVIREILDHLHATNPTNPEKKGSLSEEEMKAIMRSFAGKKSVEDILFSLEAELFTNAKSAEWITKTKHQLNRQSPTSLKITFALLQHAEQSLNLDLRQCLELEYRIMMHCMSGWW